MPRRGAEIPVIAAVLAVVLAAPLIEPADPVRFLRGYDIGAACRDRSAPASAEICYAFVLGVVQTAAAAGVPQRLCLPDSLTRGALLGAVRQHMRRAPAALDASAEAFVLDALERSYPCP